MSSKRYDDSKQWYAIHTYSGYEEKVAESIRQRINGVDMADKIFDVIVPKEKQIQIRNGKRKIVEAKIFQGYVIDRRNLVHHPQHARRYRICGRRHYANSSF